MRIEKPEIFVAPRAGRFCGYRRLPQFVRTRQRLLDVHVIGLWWLTIAWLAPAKKRGLPQR